MKKLNAMHVWLANPQDFSKAVEISKTNIKSVSPIPHNDPQNVKKKSSKDKKGLVRPDIPPVPTLNQKFEKIIMNKQKSGNTISTFKKGLSNNDASLIEIVEDSEYTKKTTSHQIDDSKKTDSKDMSKSEQSNSPGVVKHQKSKSNSKDLSSSDKSSSK